MSLDISTLLNSMVSAAKTSLTTKWPAIADLATSSLKSLAQNLVDIEKMKVAGTLDPERAQMLLDMQKNTIKIVLLSEEGLGLLAAEAAINAAIDAVKTAVNAAIGFTIL